MEAICPLNRSYGPLLDNQGEANFHHLLVNGNNNWLEIECTNIMMELPLVFSAGPCLGLSWTLLSNIALLVKGLLLHI